MHLPATNSAPVASGQGRARRCNSLAILLTAASIAITALPAAAQFNNGAIIVTVPSSGDDAAPAAKAPPSRPKAKRTPPKRRTTARRPQRSASLAGPTAADKLKIAVLVNDDPITQYEISQRAILLAGGAGLGKQAQANFKNLIKQKSTNDRLRAILKDTVEGNRGRSREQILAIFERRKKEFAVSLQRQAVDQARKSILPSLRSKATQELIDERLKLQAAKQAKVAVSKAQLDEVMAGIAKRNKLTYAAFKEQLKKQGTDINAMRSRVSAQLSWMRVINYKFGRFVDVNQKAIDETVVGGNEADKISLHLHRLVFQLPVKLDQRIVAQRIADADRVRANFKGCATTRKLAQSAKDLTFLDMGYRVAAEVAEPTRSLLLNARDGEMAPPVTTRDGVALYAVCARRAGTKSFEAREAAERNLREKGTEIYGRKYLSDLRREAQIEYRIK